MNLMLWIRRAYDWLSRRCPQALPPTANYGRCLRCHVSWENEAGHPTLFDMPRPDAEPEYPVDFGVMVLCVACWSGLAPADRLPYYRALWELWLSDTVRNGWHDKTPVDVVEHEIDRLHTMWRGIQRAVEAGA